MMTQTGNRSSSIDLHVHTTFSDGLYDPDQLIRIARDHNIGTLSITDHDSLLAYETLSQDDMVYILPGIEISADLDGRELHILGYGFNVQDAKLQSLCRDSRGHRKQRAEQILKRLKQKGLHVDTEDLNRIAGPAAISRPHIARLLLEKGLVRTYQEAFNRFLADEAPTSVDLEKPDVASAIEWIHQAGGLSVLAHPVLYSRDTILDQCLEMGIDGLECYHPRHRLEEEETLKTFCRAHELLITGGSDFHGIEGQDPTLGCPFVPFSCFVDLLQQLPHQQAKHPYSSEGFNSGTVSRHISTG